MKVLHVISTLDTRYGGPVAALLGLCEAQIFNGIQVSVVANGSGDSTEKRLSLLGVDVGILQPPLRLGRLPHSSMRILEQGITEADIVHIHGLWEEVQHQASYLARRYRKPVVFRPCGMLDPWSLSQGRWKKKLYLFWRQRRDLNMAATLHFTTSVEAELAKPLGLKAPSLVEPNGINLTEFQELPPPDVFRANHPSLGACPFILFMSRIHPKKGLDLLIPAFAKANLKKTMLVIAGPDEDNYRAHVEKMVLEHGIEKHVVFTEMLEGEQSVAALAEAELFVLPSYQENFGNVVVEALAARTPVIISDQVNIHGEVAAGGVGVVVPLNVERLAHEMTHWMRDDDIRTKAVERTWPFVCARYNWLQIGARWISHYELLVASST